MAFNPKKAQAGGGGAAVLIAIIAGLIILYILFLPSVEREQILEGDRDSAKHSDEDNILLKESVGTIGIRDDVEERKDIQNVFLLEQTNAKQLHRENDFTVRRGWFDKAERTVEFELDDMENTDNVMLSFAVEEGMGTLSVALNGNPLYDNTLQSGNVNPIKLSKSDLKDKNTLTFSVSPVGLKFWTTNLYDITNLQVTGDITDKSRQESRNIFELTPTEYENLEKADLRFIPYCSNVGSVGILDVFVNNRNVFSAVPVCEDPYRQIVPTNVFAQGENTVVFRTAKGSYSVEQIYLDLEYEDVHDKTFYFEINDTRFDEIVRNRDEVVLTIEFTDSKEDKQGVIDVNGRLRSFDLDERTYSLVIDNYIEKGNNYVRIEPETELNIVEIMVRVNEDN